jgi:hypothetical protein
MAPTTINATINSQNFGAAATRIDIWHEGGGIGHWEIMLDNISGASQILDCDYVASNLGINGVNLMQGTVDDILPEVSDPSAVFSKYVTVHGRNCGQDLTNLFIIKKYAGVRLNWMMDDALSVAGSSITHVGSLTPSPPLVDADFNKTYLQNGFVDACALADYDFTVKNDNSLQLWPLASAPDSGVLLKSIPGDIDNNILLIGETKAGIDRRNYIRLDAGSLNDHWTEGNAIDFSPVNCTVDDEYSLFVAGASSIRATILGASSPEITLVFPLYNHDYLDYQAISETGTVWVLHETSGFLFGDKLNKNVSIYAKDTDGNRILWSCDKNTWTGEWTEHTFQLGLTAPFGSSTDMAKWYYITGSSFNWKIVELGVIVNNYYSTEAGKHVWIDGLKLPSVEVYAIAQDV